MSKITISHYLNKRLKCSHIDGSPAYPVYIRVTYKRNNVRIKSRWIDWDVTECEFDTDPVVNQIMIYETNVIETICNKYDISILSLRVLLGSFLQSISSYYLSSIIDVREIVKQLIAYISKQTGLSEKIFSPYVNSNRLDDSYSYKEWYELANAEILPKETKMKVTYLAMLCEYEHSFIPKCDNPNISYIYKTMNQLYHLDTFNYFEWRNNNGKTYFLDFAKSKGLLEDSLIEKITEKIDAEMTSLIAFWGDKMYE